MKHILVPYVLVPVAILAVVTVVRAWLEVNSPDAAATDFVSANVLSLLWTLVVPALLLRRGASIGQGLLAGLLFYVMHRAVIGGVYALAWADQWKVGETMRPVRYVKQVREVVPDDASALQVFLGATFFPVPFGLVMLLVVWTITWAVAFRSKRPFARAAQPVS